MAMYGQIEFNKLACRRPCAVYQYSELKNVFGVWVQCKKEALSGNGQWCNVLSTSGPQLPIIVVAVVRWNETIKSEAMGMPALALESFIGWKLQNRRSEFGRNAELNQLCL